MVRSVIDRGLRVSGGRKGHVIDGGTSRGLALVRSASWLNGFPRYMRVPAVSGYVAGPLAVVAGERGSYGIDGGVHGIRIARWLGRGRRVRTIVSSKRGS